MADSMNENVRWALVTGAASGIGKATAESALDHGYRVVCADRDGEHLAERFGSVAGATIVECDVTDQESVSRAFDAADGQVSLAVNCAGISDRTLLEDLTDEAWARVLDINLGGTMRLDREGLRRMPGGSVIVNIASIAGHRSFAARAAYCSSKAAIVALTEVVALEAAHKGIRVIAVSPGFVSTPMATAVEGLVDDQMILSRSPLERLASASEIAQAVVALAGDEFSFMTGTTVVVDGGWCANGGFWPLPALEARRGVQTGGDRSGR
jgi:NAD(P)-dependent dehydrogenase (short-subunit alcohol dehydrogenase family)